MPRPDHPLVAILSIARDAGVELKIRGDELIVTAIKPEPALIDALRRHKAGLQVLCRASSDLGVGLAWSARQLSVDDDPADCGYACIHHFLEHQLVQERTHVGSDFHELEPHLAESRTGVLGS